MNMYEYTWYYNSFKISKSRMVENLMKVSDDSLEIYIFINYA